VKNFEPEVSLDAVRPVKAVGAVRPHGPVLLPEKWSKVSMRPEFCFGEATKMFKIHKFYKCAFASNSL
jgi:hypothetical protein